VARVAERATHAAVHGVEHRVGEFHFVAPALWRVMAQVIRPIEPLLIVAGMKHRVVAQLVTDRRDVAPGGNVFKKATLQVRIKRAA